MFWRFLWQHARPIGETLKAWAEIIAYISAVLFFFWKFVSGYFVADASLKLSIERAPSPPVNPPTNRDLIGVTASLKKGERSAIRLHDAKVRFTTYPAGTAIDIKPLLGIERFTSITDPASGLMSIEFTTALNNPRLNLPPGDESELAAACEVSADQTVLIEAVVLGVVYRPRNLLGRIRTFLFAREFRVQWRATHISLPRAP